MMKCVMMKCDVMWRIGCGKGGLITSENVACPVV